MKRFAGKRVVVTGGTRGIGRAIVERLLEEGASVCFSSRKQKAVDATVSALTATHGPQRVYGVVAHLGKGSRQALIERAVELWGEVDEDGERGGSCIDGLVLNAAISPANTTNVLGTEEDNFAKVLGTNVTANAMLVQQAAPFLVPDTGAVVFISSVAAYQPSFPIPVYGQYFACLCLSCASLHLKRFNITGTLCIAQLFSYVCRVDCRRVENCSAWSRNCARKRIG